MALFHLERLLLLSLRGGVVMRMSRVLFPVAFWPFAWLLLGAAGCRHDDGVARLPLSGTVSRAGGEKVNGSISFLPAQGRAAPAAVGSIVKGEYRFDKTNGPTAGASQVVIRPQAVKRASQPGTGGNPPTAGKPAGPQRAPKTEWEFPVAVPADGPYRFDFKLD
jgi:hypothetical protein